jgi:PAS domain S-box-containing protein
MGRTLDKEVLIGVGVFIALLVVIPVLNHRNTNQLNKNAASVAHSQEVLGLTADVLLTLVDAETGQRGFIITGKDDFLQPYNAALGRLDERLAKLKDKTKLNPRQQDNIRKLTAMTTNRLALLEEGITLRRKSDLEAQAFITARKGKQEMDAIRELVGEMKREETDVLKEREGRSSSAYQTAVSTGLLSALLGLGLFGVFIWLLRRSLTIRQKVAALLNEQREWFHTTLASIGDAVIATDSAGRVTFMNRVAQDLTGWADADAKGVSLEEVFRIVNEDTRQPVENPALRVSKEGHVVGLANHTLMIAKDGTERPIDDSAAPIRDDGGRVIGCVLIFRDFTERRRLDKDHASRLVAVRLLASIVESSEDAIVSKSLDGIIQSWNAAAERVFGYTAKQAVGRHISLIIPADRAHEEEQIIARIRAGKQVKHFDTVRVRSDGQPIPISLTISPVKDEAGQVIGASKIARDITERKLAEAATAERNRLTALRAEVSTALASDGDQRAVLQECTTALVRYLEVAFARIWTLNEAEGVLDLRASAGIYTHLDGPHSRVKVGEFKIGRIASSRQPHLTNDVPHDPQVSDQAWARREGLTAFAGYPLAVEGRVLGVLGMFARRTLPDEVLADLEPLANMIAMYLDRRRVEEELRRVAAELSEADHRKNEFLTTLAHELLNPLAPIRNGLQLIRLAGGEAATVEQARTMMERQLTQLVRLVDDLMDISRISRGKITFQKERVELAAVANSAVESSRPLIEQQGHELTVMLPKQPVIIEADPTRLAQVFVNLLNNAAKYSNRGGHIWLTAERQRSDVVVSVRDTGIGIPADQLPRIFEMYSQVERSLEKSQGGLGIGLTLVKRLVEMHGGSVEAHSEGPGKGSEFVVRLPVVVEPYMPQAAGEPSQPAVPISSLRILIVDDNRDGADSLALMLRIMGNDTRTAYDGQAGVRIFGEFRPDVVLLDIGLPKLNGYEACRRIRELPLGKDIVMVAVTGWGQEDDRRRSQEAGFNFHIVKPVDPQALEKLLTGLQQVTMA